MQKIITETGREFIVAWCGLSTIDFVLRFEVKGETMQDILATFTNKEETGTITHVFDEHETIFSGYSKFKGVDLKPGGSIVVSLMEG